MTVHSAHRRRSFCFQFSNKLITRIEWGTRPGELGLLPLFARFASKMARSISNVGCHSLIAGSASPNLPGWTARLSGLLASTVAWITFVEWIVMLRHFRFLPCFSFQPSNSAPNLSEAAHPAEVGPAPLQRHVKAQTRRYADSHRGAFLITRGRSGPNGLWSARTSSTRRG